MAGIATNRTNIELPVEVAQEIIQKTQEASSIMKLGRQIALPGRGVEIPVITGDPEATWVAETGQKTVSNPSLSQKIMRAYKLAVIVPFSDEFARDAASLYDALIARLPGSLAYKFDATVYGNGTKPGDDFDTFASVTAHSISPESQSDVEPDVYKALVAADTDISTNGGISNGYVFSPQGKGILLAARDQVGRPLFVNSVADGAIPMILGNRTEVSKGAYVPGAQNTDPIAVGFVGDWTKALWGTVEGVKIDFSKEATLNLGNDATINLFQDNMFAVRAEIEVGFRADTSVFNKFTITPSMPSM